jgi:hypothetical protein
MRQCSSIAGRVFFGRIVARIKMSSSEVLISVTLNGRGEVAEWLKAAVC